MVVVVLVLVVEDVNVDVVEEIVVETLPPGRNDLSIQLGVFEPKRVDICTAALNFLEKLARLPDAPAPL